VAPHLDLGDNGIEDEGAGWLAAVLPQCTSLAHLHHDGNGIGDEGDGQLAAVLPQSPSLAHLDLGGNGIGAEGAGLLRAAALPSLDLTLWDTFRSHQQLHWIVHGCALLASHIHI